MKQTATPQFTIPAGMGVSMTVVCMAIAESGWLPPAFTRPEVATAVTGLAASGASALAAWVNALLRERKRQRNGGHQS